MRFYEDTPEGREARLNLNEDRIGRAQEFLVTELEDAYAARAGAEERNWEENLRQYHARPRQAVRSIPIENAPNIEVPLVAMGCDALYAMVLDLIFSMNPIVTARAATRDNPEMVEVAKGAQDFGNWGERNEWQLRPAFESSALDCILLGTGVLHTPYLNYTKQTDVNRVVDRGPRILSVPVEDFLMPGGAYNDIQEMPWVAHRMFLTEGELHLRARQLKWNIDDVEPITTVGWVRSRREQFGRTRTNLKLNRKLYEIHKVYAYFDIDNDGFDEDVEIIFERTSRQILKLTYNGYDCRPYSVGRYQLLAHLPYGMGAAEMLRPFQESFTEMHNARVLNVLMANYRMWLNRIGSGLDQETLEAYPGKVINVNDMDAFKELQMSTVHTPAAAMVEQSILSLAERRVGTGELANPRPSNLLSSRTPGITAMTAMQTVNRRFTAAFDQMRFMGADAVKQCYMRYRERILVEGERGPAATNIRKIVGPERGAILVSALKAADFHENVLVEFTASSALVNQQAERQDALQLVNILSQYYSNVLQMMTIASAPETPDPVKEVARKIATAGGEAIERTIRAFDTVRDPQQFIIDVNQEIDQLAGGMNGDILGQLGQLIGIGANQAAEGVPLLGQ